METKKYTEDFNKIPHGLYKIKWKTGGSSLAAVGSDWEGNRWHACTNWVNLDKSLDWSKVKSAKLLKK